MTQSPLTPEAVPLARAPAVFGLSRSSLYRLAGAGQIRLLKIGSRTLVDAASVRRFLAELPQLEPRRDPRRTLATASRSITAGK